MYKYYNKLIQPLNYKWMTLIKSFLEKLSQTNVNISRTQNNKKIYISDSK